MKLAINQRILFAFLVVELCSARSFAQPPTTITLEPTDGGLLVMRATIRGHSGRFLFDSGSGVSNITPAFAAMIGCKPWGQISGFRMTGERIDMPHCDDVSMQFAGVSSKPAAVGVFDLGKVLPASISGIDGTIALDVFANRIIRFSYAHHLISILNPQRFERHIQARRDVMPIHVVRDAQGLALSVDIPVQTMQGLAWFELDSGNSSSFILLGKHLANLFGLDPSLKNAQAVEVDIPGGIQFRGAAKVLDLILDGNLGTTFLMKFDVTLDLRHNRLLIEPVNPLPPAI